MCARKDEQDIFSYEEGYSDGFERGAEAVVQQIDGIISECMDGVVAINEVRQWICDFWKERES